VALEEQIFTVLTGDPDVGAIVGTKVYPKKIPQGISVPAIRYIRVSDPRLYSLSGMGSKTNPRMQIDCWAATYAVARDLAEKVIAAMNAATAFKIGAADVQDIDEGEEEDHRVSVDFSIWV
jgi:hypothetical protein